MEQNELAILIRDMAGEFIAARRNTSAYAYDRYPWMNEKQLTEKVAEVDQRKAQAERIHELSGEIAEFILKTEAAINGGT